MTHPSKLTPELTTQDSSRTVRLVVELGQSEIAQVHVTRQQKGKRGRPPLLHRTIACEHELRELASENKRVETYVIDQVTVNDTISLTIRSRHEVEQSSDTTKEQ